MNTLKNTILKQKSELEVLSSRPFNSRHKDEFLQKVFNQSNIKVIIGPRRAGKSTLALHFIKNKNFAYINFDDKSLSEVENHIDLDVAIEEVYGKVKNMFLDEIQNLAKWELWVNTLHRRSINVIVTGSNANLLSTELSTHLTGRYIEIEVLPFSYAEYGKDFETFYRLGGFPDILLNNQDEVLYTDGLQNSVILKDIVGRHHIRHHDKISALFNFIRSNAGCIVNYKNLEAHLDLGEKTIKKYIGYLSDSYLCFELLPFSYKAKEYYRSNKKVYLIDNVFIKKDISLHIHNSKKLENHVFLELFKSGLKPNRDIFYYKTKNNFEIDFVIKKDFKIQTLIQVCYDMNNTGTKEREFRALKKAQNELGGEMIIITYGDDEYTEDGIHVVGVKKFMQKINEPSAMQWNL